MSWPCAIGCENASPPFCHCLSCGFTSSPLNDAGHCVTCWKLPSSEDKHSPACDEAVRRLRVFDATWPGACKACGGRGFWNDPGSYYRPPDGGPCPSCVEQDLCPMCGASGLTSVERELEDSFKCQSCVWDERKIDEGTFMAEFRPDFDCSCWEEIHANDFDTGCAGDDEGEGWQPGSEDHADPGIVLLEEREDGDHPRVATDADVASDADGNDVR